MRRWLSVAVTLLVISTGPAFAWTAPTGSRLPTIVGGTLSGKKVTFPEDLAGRPAVLLIGFTRDSRTPVEAWAKALAKAGIDPAETPIYPMPMIGNGIGTRLARPFIDSGMRGATPKAEHDHVVTVYGDLQPIKQGLHVTPEHPAYVVLVDRSGTIAGAWVGPPADAAIAELRARLKGL
ncbi:MAG: hypothetical protein H7338_02570 [Candidatus Sericytochromatia bacterium]|nr:hypothetical protein [Candidatus Sericytochromatia bacterium]